MNEVTKKSGITFESKNEYNYFLHKILENISIISYTWEMSEDTIISNTNNEFKLDNLMIGHEIFNKLLPNYYIIFMKLCAYSNSQDKKRNESIKNYSDFLSSDCEICIMVIDTVYYTIYCKDEKVLDLIYKNLKKYEFYSIQYLSNISPDKKLKIWA